MTEEELKAIEARESAADSCDYWQGEGVAHCNCPWTDWARADLSALVAEVRRLRQWLLKSARCPLHPEREECHIVAFAEEPVWSHRGPRPDMK